MRYADPDSGVIVRKTVAVVTAGDYFPFVVGGTIISFAAGFGALGIIIEENNALGALLFLPLIIMVAMATLTYAKSHGSEASSTGDRTLNKAFPLFDQIRGTTTEVIARPIIRKIYAHAVEDGHEYFGECRGGSCDERIAMLRKLVPSNKSVSNKSDLDAAKQYIKMIDDAERSHQQILKELGEG